MSKVHLSEAKVGIILQARMGSSRLPGKVLMPFGKTTLLGWILKRVEHLPWPVVVATSSEEQDKQISAYCLDLGVPSFSGSERDVLDRYYHCALTYGFDHIVRLTGDNPFPDTEELVRMVNHHISNQDDYTHNIGVLPVGVGAEVFSFEALYKSWEQGHQPHHREHVNEYIIENPARFKTSYVAPPLHKQSGMQFTIDTASDYERVLSYLDHLENQTVTTERLLKQCISSV